MPVLMTDGTPAPTCNLRSYSESHGFVGLAPSTRSGSSTSGSPVPQRRWRPARATRCEAPSVHRPRDGYPVLGHPRSRNSKACADAPARPYGRCDTSACDSAHGSSGRTCPADGAPSRCTRRGGVRSRRAHDSHNVSAIGPASGATRSMHRLVLLLVLLTNGLLLLLLLCVSPTHATNPLSPRSPPGRAPPEAMQGLCRGGSGPEVELCGQHDPWHDLRGSGSSSRGGARRSWGRATRTHARSALTSCT